MAETSNDKGGSNPSLPLWVQAVVALVPAAGLVWGAVTYFVPSAKDTQATAAASAASAASLARNAGAASSAPPVAAASAGSTTTVTNSPGAVAIGGSVTGSRIEVHNSSAEPFGASAPTSAGAQP